MRRGRGGITRSSHHSTGRLSRPSSSNGSAKVRGRPAIMRCAPLSRSSARRPCSPSCRSAGTATARPPSGWWCGWRTASRAGWSRRGFRRGAAPRARHSRRVQLSARPAVMISPPLRLDELDAAGIGEGLFGGIDHLHQGAMRARRGQAGQHVPDLGHRRPEIRRARRSPTSPTARKTAAGLRASHRHAASPAPSCR